MYRVTEVVKHLLIINVLMFFGTQILLGDMTFNANGSISSWGRYVLAMFYPTSPDFQPFQLISHMFMHASIGHLFFNMFGLFMFGPPLESRWGAKKFLFYYLFTGFGALALHILVKYVELTYFGGDPMLTRIPMLGASGAIFGLLMGYGMSYPNSTIMLLIPPIPMKAKYFVMVYAAIELFAGFSGFDTGIAHFAHLGGALFGLLIILYWKSQPGGA